MHVQTAAIISCENVEAAGLRFAVSLGKELEMMTGLIYSCYFCVCLVAKLCPTLFRLHGL